MVKILKDIKSRVIQLVGLANYEKILLSAGL